MKTSYAHGGMTAHGLKVGDKIAGSQKNEVVGLNEEEQEIFITDLDKGKRESKRYNKGDKAQLESARQQKRRYAKGGNMADVGLKRAKKYINLLVENGGMSIYDTKYDVWLSYENGKFVIKNNKFNPTIEDYETIFKGDKNDAIKFVANSYQIDEMAKGGKTKKGKKEPMIVRSYFEDEAIDYGSGGAIYKGDKVRIKDTNKSMVVKNIAKGKKGYVEFTGDKGTYLKGDLEKYAKGGAIKRGSGQNSNDLMGYEPYFEKNVAIATINEKSKEVRPTHGYFPKHPMSKKAIAWAKKNGYTYIADGKKYEDGGEVGSDNYKVVKIFRKSGRKVVLEKYLTREEAMRVVARYPNSNTSMVIFTKMFEEGGMTSGWCYSIGGL